MKITAIVTAYNRTNQAVDTIRKLQDCQPAPDEILVHVDDNQQQCADAIRQAFPEIIVLLSETNVGPGGGRNKLITAARHEYVASFDDDSFPLDADYFARVKQLFEQFPEVAILCATVYHQGETIADAKCTAAWVADFSGGGCIYRRTQFLATSGYVPLPIAYGMEEVDLALRLRAQGSRILRTPWLRVFHDTDLQRHSSASITANSIANLALLTYLRYPPAAWLIGLGQCLKRVIWLIQQGRWHGILTGLLKTPQHLWAYRSYRQTIPANALRSYLKQRRNPEQVAEK